MYLAEWCYNPTTHLATNLTSYEIVYGKPPPSISNYQAGTFAVEAIEFFLTLRQETFHLLRKKLEKA